MKKTFMLFAFCLAAHTLLCPFPAQARDQFIINYIDPTPEAIVTGEEMTAWLEADKGFAEAEAELIDAYHSALDKFGPGGEGWLGMNQSDWAKYRQEDAYTKHGPKGSPGYLAFLAEEARSRTKWLNRLGQKGKVYYAQNYIYQEPGYEGMVILYLRDRGQEMELYTKNLGTGAVCTASGDAETKDGKASYGPVKVELLELGKSLNLTSAQGKNVCEPGGKFTGFYLLTK